MKALYRYFLVFAIIAFCAIGNVFAQQDFKATGVIFERGTKIRIALAEVTNLRSGLSVGSSDLGLFQIKALVGDTLWVSKRGYTEMKLVVQGTKDMVIFLNAGTNTLNEVTVTGQSKKKALDQIKKDFKDKGVYYNGKANPLLLIPFGGHPLTFLYNLLGKEPKNARRFGKMYQAETQFSVVDALYNKSTINAQTGLEGKELEDFLVKYRPDYEKAKNWVQYDAIKWINDSYKNYTDSLTKIK